MKLGGGGGEGNELNEGKAGSAGALRAKFGAGDFVGGRTGGWDTAVVESDTGFAVLARGLAGTCTWRLGEG
jgi:hypothetical protein